MDATTATALIDESARRSGLVWVTASDAQAVPLWHVWDDGTLYLLTGGDEQRAPAGIADGGSARVTVRSKDKGSRLVVWDAAVATVRPDGADWSAAVALLGAKRLNAADGQAAPERWARECTVLALRPVGDPVETPDDPSTASHAQPPVATPATTPVPRPWQLFGRRRRGRPTD